MTRSISANALAKITQNDGAEPINVIGVQWVDGGQVYYYADRNVPGVVLGRIMSLAQVDNVTQTSGSGQSQAVNVVLQDTDGTIKNIIDSHDIHLRPCWVYQWFGGLNFSDKFLIFRGLINTPITWKEGDRTITFDVISKIEDAEIGFSIEEGDFLSPNPDLIGKAWPLCFGTVINAPALRLQSPMQGTLATGIGIADWTLEEKLEKAKALLCPYQFQGYDFYYTSGGTPNFEIATGGAVIVEQYGEEPSCVASRCKDVKTIEAEIAVQKSYEAATFQVYGGENFPQGVPLKLNVNGAIFEGSFAGQIFTITKRTHPDLANPLTKATQGIDVVPDLAQCAIPPSTSQYQIENANSDIGGPTTQQIQDAQDAYNNVPSSQFFWANPGTTVTIESLQLISYVANILPSTILRVAAYRNTDAGQILVTVPPEAYTILQSDYNGYQVMELVFGRPLSSIGQGWSDDLYVTLTSSVGPNTVDIIKWLIQTYSSHGIDDTSFDHVRALIDNYPMHFLMPGRMSLLDALDKIAYQARCAVWLKDDTFFIKYLSEEPTSDDTVDADSILTESFELSHTPTEDLVTKYIATWQADYAKTDKNTIIYRSNVKKYGTHEEDYDYFCFNIVELVRKSATFWLIRKANTWRKATFKTPLNKLNLEVFDCLTVDHPALSSTPVKTMVEQASYDSATNSISFTCWTPIRSGEKTVYDFAWPADVSETLIYPTVSDQAAGFAGGGNGPNFNVVAPPNSTLNNTQVFIQGFQLECNGKPVRRVTEENIECHEDFGLRKPSDRGDTKPSPKATTDNSDVQSGYNPLPTSGNTPSADSCCQEALKTAQEALTEARKAAGEAAGGNDAGGGAGSNPDMKRLPSSKNKQKDGKCLYLVKVTKGTVTRVLKPDGTQSTQGGATGDVINDTNRSQEQIGFNDLAAAQAYADGVQKLIHSYEEEFQATVGARIPLSVTPPIGAVNFGNCTKDTGPTKMVSYDAPGTF